MKQSEHLIKIKKATNCERYDMNDFYAVCPIPVDVLKSRKQTGYISRWRQVGMVCARMSGMTQEKAGELFNRKHCNVIHAEKMVANSFHPLGDKWLNGIFKEVVK
jgi:chromosomal replication initiation ATPase DnaA